MVLPPTAPAPKPADPKEPAPLPSGRPAVAPYPSAPPTARNQLVPADAPGTFNAVGSVALPTRTPAASPPPTQPVGTPVMVPLAPGR